MGTIAQIGKSIHIKGTVTSDEPLTVAGSVEGSIAINGHELTITPDGTVNADATAETILIEGAAKGRLTATTRMTLRATATVTGEIVAATLSVAEGAKIQGRVQTGSPKGLKTPASVPAAAKIA